MYTMCTMSTSGRRVWSFFSMKMRWFLILDMVIIHNHLLFPKSCSNVYFEVEGGTTEHICVFSSINSAGRYGYIEGNLPICANPLSISAAPMCCELDRTETDFAYSQCGFQNERVSMKTAQARCEAKGMEICDFYRYHWNHYEPCDWWRAYFWTDKPCTILAQVQPDGTVGFVHDINIIPDDPRSRYGPNPSTFFQVQWVGDGTHPHVNTDATCSGVCTVEGVTCLCPTTVTTEAVFTNEDTMITRDDVRSQLTIGAFDPLLFDEGAYALCSSTLCTDSYPDVAVYTMGGKTRFAINWRF